MSENKELTKAIYTGKSGAFYSGVPARDLLESDWARLTAAQQKLLSKSPIYEMVVRKKATASKKAGE